MGQQWKAAERFIAKTLGGVRIPRGANFSKSLPDVVAPANYSIARSNGIIFAESKYSVSNPWVRKIEELCKVKKFVRIISERSPSKSLIFFDIRDTHVLTSPSALANAEPIYIDTFPNYIIEHLKQSVDYLDIVKKDPITVASIQSLINLSPITEVILPIVVLTERYKSFRVSYTSYEWLLNFYLSQNDQSFRNI